MECRFHRNQKLDWIYIANGPQQGTFQCSVCQFLYSSFLVNMENQQNKLKDRKFVLNEIPPKIVQSLIHKINSSILPLSIFQKYLEEQQQNNYFNTQPLTDMRKSISKKQKKIEETFSRIQTILREFEQQNTYLQELFKLPDGESPISKISGERLRFLAHAIENDVIQQWQEWRNKCIKEIEETLCKLAKGFDDFDQIIQVCVEEKDSKLIEVKEACGMKYGEQNYIINGSIELAGRYFANNPMGMWHQYGKQQSMKESNFQILYEHYLMKYMKDGVILKILPYNQEQKIIENIEQLKYLEEKGYVRQNKKSGLQLYYWKGECLNSGGKYDEQGNKDGSWKELPDNYQDNSQVILHKNYKDGSLQGDQKIIFDEEIIGGGTFIQREKDGNWTEIHEKFCRNLQIIEKGKYKKGRKFEKWEICLNNKIIGGGDYNVDGNKIGQWKELHECYNVDSRIVYNGQYKKGNKDGIWQIMDNAKQIGGGVYKDCKKHGEWTEISGNFLKPDMLQINSEIYFNGSYEKGKKQGKWTFKFDNKLDTQGEYDNGLKNGIWTELSTNFNQNQQIVAKGEYEQGFRIGCWKILRNSEMMLQNHINCSGGGIYNKGRKEGDWIELEENFEKSIILLKGKYNNQGLKFGDWSIYDGLVNDDQNKIGGGSYNNQFLKNGKWIEIYDGCNNSRILYEGEYQNGIRVSQWNILEIKKIEETNIKIGGGEFDNLGRKNGSWIELDKNYLLNCKVKYEGNYCFGRKSGVWKAIYLNYNNETSEVYGSGEYDENGMKIGDWTELHHNFSDLSKITLKGSYSEGIKQGTWMICKNNQEVKLGNYDKNGLKDGEWEISEYSQNQSQKCMYKNGIRQK